jgi:hypothetical protein
VLPFINEFPAVVVARYAYSIIGLQLLCGHTSSLAMHRYAWLNLMHAETRVYNYIIRWVCGLKYSEHVGNTHYVPRTA